MLSFSNRFFATKAIRMWLQTDDEGRQRIAASYFMYAPSGGWRDVSTQKLPAKAPTKAAATGGAECPAAHLPRAAALGLSIDCCGLT